MFRKKDEELLVPEPEVPREETAYEDNWYRSLKAMREQQERDEPEGDDALEAETQVETQAEPVEATAETVEEASQEPLPEELEERAGQLLERLRTLQHLADEAPPDPEAEPKRSSVWG